MAFRTRKNIRLPKEMYSFPNQIFSITICTKDHQPIFRNNHWSKIVTQTLQTGPFGQKTKCHAFCLMPDHLHIQISPKDGNLVDLIDRWKSYTANRLRKEGLEGPCWQRRFYDHALRKDEDIQTVAEYIVNNPVRAGMVENWRDYPFSWHEWI